MDQSHKPLPSPHRPVIEPAPKSNAETGILPLSTTEQSSRPLAPQLAPKMMMTMWHPTSTTVPKAPMTRANWVNVFWADISAQLRRFSVLSSDLFHDLLLKRNTVTGKLILAELRKKYEQLGDDREWATVRVLTPERMMSGLWQLLWTIKRQRDPNGRQVHSQTIIDPINHETHLELDSNPGRTFSGPGFELPPFIQDYGPLSSEFEPEPESEFDAMVRSVLTDANAGTWAEESGGADGIGGKVLDGKADER